MNSRFLSIPAISLAVDGILSDLELKRRFGVNFTGFIYSKIFTSHSNRLTLISTINKFLMVINSLTVFLDYYLSRTEKIDGAQK